MHRPFAILITMGLISALALSPSVAEAGLLFHAAKRSAAQSIFKGGFRKSLMERRARFGAGAYLSKGRATALSERPSAKSVITFNKGKGFDRKVLDTRSMSTEQLKAKFHIKDMRGTVKNGVIGPKLGHRIGNSASRNNRIVAYRSARDPRGTNYLIPKRTYSPKTKMISPVSIMNVTGRER